MDPVYLRRKFGKSFNMIGGIDKRELAKGPREIESEVAKIVPLLEGEGYIPTVDHTVPPDVSFKNYLYYLECKNRAIIPWD